jgi:hypothetical protein
MGYALHHPWINETIQWNCLLKGHLKWQFRDKTLQGWSQGFSTQHQRFLHRTVVPHPQQEYESVNQEVEISYFHYPTWWTRGIFVPQPSTSGSTGLGCLKWVDACHSRPISEDTANYKFYMMELWLGLRLLWNNFWITSLCNTLTPAEVVDMFIKR